jgi:hypothetical protein
LLKTHYCYERKLNIWSSHILNLSALELQCSTLKYTMKANITCAMEPPILLNPFIRLWRTLSTSKNLQNFIS